MKSVRGIAAILLVLAGAPAYPQYEQESTTRVEVIFEGVATLRDGTVPVRISHWSLDNHEKATTLPRLGTQIVQLRGGVISTIIDGTRRRRVEGEVWTVERGQTMLLETHGDTVLLSTIDIGE
ncbi:MAG TPA: hypothetical protein VGQ36_19110 [Thermoanaerobaculia bacterium]|jgi:hypothetical protein|nr:hypothetical protein [Thermoanaerobaculia bacterium]